MALIVNRQQGHPKVVLVDMYCSLPWNMKVSRWTDVYKHQ